MSLFCILSIECFRTLICRQSMYFLRLKQFKSKESKSNDEAEENSEESKIIQRNRYDKINATIEQSYVRFRSTYLKY